MAKSWSGLRRELEEEFICEYENSVVEDAIEENAIQSGVFEIYHITSAIREYKSMSIQESLYSENPIVRMFAIMDRRIGKRTLIKVSATIDQHPEWLKYFYNLRLDADDIKR